VRGGSRAQLSPQCAGPRAKTAYRLNLSCPIGLPGCFPGLTRLQVVRVLRGASSVQGSKANYDLMLRTVKGGLEEEAAVITDGP